MASTTSNPQPQAPPKMTPEGAETFRKAVKYIFTEWPSLTLVMENMGGQQAREIRDWMCNTVAETMLKEKDIELDDFLYEMIDNEFDSRIEDGSLEYNTKWIEKFYKDCLQGKQQDVINSINQAAAKKQSLGNVRIPPPVCQTQESSDEDDDDDEDMDDG